MPRTLCQRCRREVGTEDAVCPGCGLSAPAERPYEEGHRSPAPDAEHFPPDHQAAFRFFSIAAAIFVLLAIGITILALLAARG